MNFTKFTQRLDSPQMKRDLMSSMKTFLYKLFPELPSDLKFRILGK